MGKTTLRKEGSRSEAFFGENSLYRVCNAKSPITLFSVFIHMKQGTFDLPEYVSALYTNLTNIQVRQNASAKCKQTQRTKIWDFWRYLSCLNSSLKGHCYVRQNWFVCPQNDPGWAILAPMFSQ